MQTSKCLPAESPHGHGGTADDSTDKSASLLAPSTVFPSLGFPCLDRGLPIHIVRATSAGPIPMGIPVRVLQQDLVSWFVIYHAMYPAAMGLWGNDS